MDSKEISEILLKEQPIIPHIEKDIIETLLTNENDEPWLIHFTDGDHYDVELRKLPFLLKEDMKVLN